MVRLLVEFVRALVICIINLITDSEEELKEKILATIHHCSNSHTFANNKHHKACGHGELKEEDRYKPWLDEGSEVSHILAG